ncbi:hypothetical protein [Humisphaera borealis]|uniref:Lipopolysaccharide assembly protein A domain-containing protein n=1 Tax=Humisphaera borealis TaxID=2807512 RepID=A0A7M2WT66_9BACT|nr:hypothetical protein [Humisphaera borealis]QOV88623.1 hypothetical protein IPV69_20630 [Humisphaera borealis]
MADFWLKLKIWSKVVAVSLAVIYLSFFAINNSEETAKLWFFFGAGREVTTSVLKLVLIAFISGVVVTILIRTTFRTIAQIRELKQRQAVEKREQEFTQLKEKAGMLQTKTKGDGAAPTV